MLKTITIWDEEIDIDSLSQEEINKKVAEAKEKYYKQEQEDIYYGQ